MLHELEGGHPEFPWSAGSIVELAGTTVDLVYIIIDTENLYHH